MGWTDFFDVSLDRANDLYTWGWRLSVGGALITMVGVASLWWGTRVRDHDFENQMTSLNSEAASARERAGNLEVRAAGLENEAAQARLEQERLKQAMAWRILTQEIGERLITALATTPATVNRSVTIVTIANDPEIGRAHV
jgi:hypothetical protein